MGSLLIHDRPGLYVVSGYVVSAKPDKCEVVLENEVRLPGKGVSRRRCRIRFLKKENFQMMPFKPGDFTFVTVKQTESLKELAKLVLYHDPAAMDLYKGEYFTFGYSARYTGSCDIEPCRRTKAPEEHIFCGAVYGCDMRKVNQKTFCRIAVGWNKNGLRQIRWVYSEKDLTGAFRQMTKCLIVTGAPLKTSGGTEWFPLKAFTSV